MTSSAVNGRPARKTGDWAVSRASGMTINIINGGEECLEQGA